MAEQIFRSREHFFKKDFSLAHNTKGNKKEQNTDLDVVYKNTDFKGNSIIVLA